MMIERKTRGLTIRALFALALCGSLLLVVGAEAEARADATPSEQDEGKAEVPKKRQKKQETLPTHKTAEEVLEGTPTSPSFMSTPTERMQAIAPLVAETLRGAEIAVKSAAVQSRATELGVSEERLHLWHDLFINHGRPGLTTLQTGFLKEMVDKWSGTWEMEGRVIEGRESTNTSTIIFEPLEVSDTSATLRVTFLETGILHSWVSFAKGNDAPYRLGSYFKVEVTSPTAAEKTEYGLTEDEDGVITTWTGEIYGDNYPGAAEVIEVRIESMIVKQGGMYNNVRAGKLESPPGKLRGSDDWNYIRLIPSSDSDTLNYGADRFDTLDTFVKSSSEPAIKNLHLFWADAKQDKTLLDPEEAKAESSRWSGDEAPLSMPGASP